MTSTVQEESGGSSEVPDIPAPPPSLQSTDYWLFRVLPLRLVLPALVFAALIAFVATIFAHNWYVPTIAAVVVTAAALTPVRGIAPVAFLAQEFTFRWRALVKNSLEGNHAPFDVPLPEGSSYGMRWDGDKLLTVLRIEAQPRTVVLLSPDGLLGDDMLPLPEIARCLDQFDIGLSCIDVISTGSRSAGAGGVARAYENVLGPLPAVANRTVWLVLRIDPLANAPAVERRGGGATGALRTAIVATRRVANRLAARGLTASVLSAAEISQAVSQLTHGPAPADFVETPHGLEHEGLHHTTYRMTLGSLEPRAIAEIWSTPTVASTITVRLQRADAAEMRRTATGRNRVSAGDPVPAGVVVTAVARFTTRDAPAAPKTEGLLPLTGKQRSALLFSLPVGTAVPALPLARCLGEPEALEQVPVPIVGCGQLIGADAAGLGVALPLMGRHVRRVEIVGSLLVAKQVILRAIALGASVVVHTTRHDEWRPMLEHIDAPQALTLATSSAGSQQAGLYRFATMVVFDGIALSGHYSDATVVVLRGHEDDSDGFAADISLVEDPDTPNLVTVRTASGETGVHMVATPEELRLVGTSPD